MKKYDHRFTYLVELDYWPSGFHYGNDPEYIFTSKKMNDILNMHSRFKEKMNYIFNYKENRTETPFAYKVNRTRIYREK